MCAAPQTPPSAASASAAAQGKGAFGIQKGLTGTFLLSGPRLLGLTKPSQRTTTSCSAETEAEDEAEADLLLAPLPFAGSVSQRPPASQRPVTAPPFCLVRGLSISLWKGWALWFVDC